MTAVASAEQARPARPDGFSRLAWFAAAVAIVATTIVVRDLAPWTVRVPPEWLPPIRAWVTDFFKWLAKDADLGLFLFRDATRAISWLLSWPLGWSESLLAKGFRQVPVAEFPWVAIVAGAGLLGHALGGRRLALFAGLGAFYLALFGVWTPAMQTLSLVLVTAPLAAAVGLGLGVAATRGRWIEAILTAAFDVMQSIPHLAYLAPVVVFFGFGQVPGLLATAIFAMPPMARCTILGIRTVPPEVIEAGRMSGCTPLQLLWKVELPSAHATLMVGLNQVIMQSLAMVVIASLIGAVGLGYELLFSLQQLRLGKAVEQGVAIVVMAVVLDRLSQRFARLEPSHHAVTLPFWRRHRHLALFLAILAASALASLWIPGLRNPPAELTISTAPLWNGAVKWIATDLFSVIQPVRDWLTVSVLIPVRNGFLWLGWLTAVVFVGLLGLRAGGGKLAASCAAMVGLIALFGFWEPALITAYYTFVAVILCVLIGVPLGIWSARRRRVAMVMTTVCDTLQTFPSFIYLIPVIMLLRVGDLSNILAIIGYASVPMIRLTYLGLLRVPTAIKEAATASGTTPRQLLWKVELPLAFPEIMLGLNQTIMMALAMTAITALIGSRDLGQEILKALPEADVGRGLLAGVSIALIGMTADRLIAAWSRQRKAELGLA
ncbi:MAG: ABC transporter permease subunit [Alphaproteobacteria bacterium]|nr:ABC transporter permease subunit [Alphaproteobacteria bacterium]